MPIDYSVTPGHVALSLLIGAVLGALLVLAAHSLRRLTRLILYISLLIAQLAYVVFAINAQVGSGWVLVEAAGVLVFGATGWRGLHGSPWWLVAAWALHPVWDLALHMAGGGPGSAIVPLLAYPIPCLSFDWVVAAYLVTSPPDPLSRLWGGGTRG
jgi:hypothetical protein